MATLLICAVLVSGDVMCSNTYDTPDPVIDNEVIADQNIISSNYFFWMAQSVEVNL